MRTLIIALLLACGCGDDGGSHDGPVVDADDDAFAEAGPEAGRRDGGGDVGSCVFDDGGVRVVHAPSGGGVLGPNFLVSASEASVSEAEPQLAVSSSGTAVIAYMAAQQGGASFIGTARASGTGPVSGPGGPLPGFGGVGATLERDPVVAYSERSSTDRRFYLAYLSHDLDSATGLPVHESVEVLVATDDGVTWQGPVRADDPADSGTLPASGPDKPWLAVSPSDGSVWIVYRSGRDALLRVVRAPPALPLAFSRPSVLVFDPADPRIVNPNPPDPQLQDLTSGGNGRPRLAVSEGGDVLVSWIHVLGSLDGSDQNTVRFARLPVTQTAFNLPTVASASSERVVFDDAPLLPSPAGSTVYVAYAVNLASMIPAPDAWEVRVARSSDDFHSLASRSTVADWGAFVNGCAVTRMRPALGLDRLGTTDRLHVVFYDNRYGAGDPGLGSLQYANSASLSFGANSFVNDADFPMTLADFGPLWLGDYTGLVVAGGRIWAAWTDTRTGIAHIEFASSPTP